MSLNLHFKLGTFFPPAQVFGGYVILLGGIIALVLTRSATSILLVLAGLLIGFTSRGCMIDPIRFMMKRYTAILGVRIGKWKPIGRQGILHLEKHSQAYGAYSWGNRYRSFKRQVYVILMEQEKSRGKDLIAIYEKEEDASEAIRQLAGLIRYAIA